MQVEQKELVEIKEQVSLVEDKLHALKIEDGKGVQVASDLLHNIKEAQKFIEEKKTNITRPLMSSLAQVRDLFKPLETTLVNANKELKAKILAYQIEENDRIEKEKARIAQRVEKGTMRTDTAVSKLEEMGEAGKNFQGEVGKTSIREVKKVKIVDEFLIPREYLVVDMKAVTEAIIRKGLTIPGVETYLEKSIVSY